MKLDHRELYRLPWSLPDNSISWLEPTAACNLACLGCSGTQFLDHGGIVAVRYETDVLAVGLRGDGEAVALGKRAGFRL